MWSLYVFKCWLQTNIQKIRGCPLVYSFFGRPINMTMPAFKIRVEIKQTTISDCNQRSVDSAISKCHWAIQAEVGVYVAFRGTNVAPFIKVRSFNIKLIFKSSERYLFSLIAVLYWCEWDSLEFLINASLLNYYY